MSKTSALTVVSTLPDSCHCQDTPGSGAQTGPGNADAEAGADGEPGRTREPRTDAFALTSPGSGGSPSRRRSRRSPPPRAGTGHLYPVPSFLDILRNSTGGQDRGRCSPVVAEADSIASTSRCVRPHPRPAAGGGVHHASARHRRRRRRIVGRPDRCPPLLLRLLGRGRLRPRPSSRPWWTGSTIRGSRRPASTRRRPGRGGPRARAGQHPCAQCRRPALRPADLPGRLPQRCALPGHRDEPVAPAPGPALRADRGDARRRAVRPARRLGGQRAARAGRHGRRAGPGRRLRPVRRRRALQRDRRARRARLRRTWWSTATTSPRPSRSGPPSRSA